MSSFDSVAIADGYPSTDLIKELLKNLQKDIKTYTRSKKSSGAIFVQSNVVYDAIIALIKQIDGSDELDWSAFERSADGVTKLEAFLLALLLKGNDLPVVPPTTTKLAEGVIFTATWTEQRKDTAKYIQDIRKCIDEAKLLTTDQRTAVNQAIEKGRKEDDVDTLKELADGLKGNPFADENLLGDDSEGTTLVTHVKDRVNEFPATANALAESYPEEALGWVVSGVMLLYIPFIVSQLEDLDAKTDEYIRSTKVWNDAKEFADFIKAFLGEGQPKVAEFEPKYTAFKAILEKEINLGPLSAQVLTLMRLVAKVRRPFYGRSVSLVKMWYTINGQEKLQKETTREGRLQVRNALKMTVKALEQAQTDITSFKEEIDNKITEVEKSFSAVYQLVNAVAKKYAEQGKVDQLEKHFSGAEETDKEHLRLFRAKIQPAAPAQS